MGNKFRLVESVIDELYSSQTNNIIDYVLGVLLYYYYGSLVHIFKDSWKVLWFNSNRRFDLQPEK